MGLKYLLLASLSVLSIAAWGHQEGHTNAVTKAASVAIQEGDCSPSFTIEDEARSPKKFSGYAAYSMVPSQGYHITIKHEGQKVAEFKLSGEQQVVLQCRKEADKCKCHK